MGNALTIKFILLLLLVPKIAISRTFPVLSSTLNKKGYRFSWDSRYFQSQSTVDSNGNERVFEPGKHFARWNNNLGFAYGFNNRFEPGIGIRHRFNNFAATGASSQGMEGLLFRFKYRIPLSPRFQLTADTRFLQTLYSENSTGQTMPLGDPGNESEWGAHLTWFANSKTSWSLYLGYRQPPNELSEEFRYHLEFFWQKKSHGLSLGVDGILSLQTDPHMTESGRNSSWPAHSTENTRLYNSFNRQWLKPYATLHYALSPRWKIRLGASRTMRVLSGDNGFEIGLGLSRTTEGVTPIVNKITKFKEYSIEANVIKVSKKQNFVQIDRGLASDISKGMKFDIYKVEFGGDNTLLASGIAWKVGSRKSIIRIFKQYTNKKLQKGALARGY